MKKRELIIGLIVIVLIVSLFSAWKFSHRGETFDEIGSPYCAGTECPQRFAIESTRIDIFDQIQELGINMREAQGVHFTKWGPIEPAAPINGVPTYSTFPKGDWGQIYLKQIKDSEVDFSVAIEYDNSKWAI